MPTASVSRSSSRTPASAASSATEAGDVRPEPAREARVPLGARRRVVLADRSEQPRREGAVRAVVHAARGLAHGVGGAGALGAVGHAAERGGVRHAGPRLKVRAVGDGALEPGGDQLDRLAARRRR